MPRVALRGAAVASVIVTFLLAASVREPLMALLGWSGPRRQRARTRAMSAWGGFLLASLRIEVECPRPEALRARGALLVSNHLGFWDVVAIASRVPAVFVTSVEVRDTPVLGWLCRAAGCIFVERRSRERSGEERAEVAQALRDGFQVMLFPEATSTDGSGVLPFKRSFFTSAIAAGSPVIPFTINYREIDGRPVTTANRDELSYYGDQRFASQLARALRLRSARIELAAADDAIPTRAGETDRSWLADEAHRAVLSRFVPVPGARA